MNIPFSFRRFWHVLLWTLAYQMRQLLTLFSAAVVAFIAVEIPEFVQARNVYMYYRLSLHHEWHETIVSDALCHVSEVCLAVGALLMCLGAVFAFYHLHRKNEGRRLLMLPATNIEKFLARWVVYVPVWFVLLLVAFMVADVLRMAIWPAFSTEITFPTAIPQFLFNLKQLVVWPSGLRSAAILLLWGLFWFFHSLSLLSSVWIGRWGWVSVAVVFFAVIALFIKADYRGADVAVFYLLAVALTIVAYWLFCRFPKYKLFHFND